MVTKSIEMKHKDHKWKLENVLKTQELFRPSNKSYGSINFTLT